MAEFDDFSFDFDMSDSPVEIPEPIVEPVEVPDIDDDAVVDALFESMTAGMENDDEVEKAAALILEAEAVMAAEERKMLALREAKAAADSKAKELEQMLLAVRREAESIREALFESGHLARQSAIKKSDAERQVAIARQAAESRRSYELKGEKYKRLAKDKAWTKGVIIDGNVCRILPHQLTGAKFLANAERAILGDGMGVGKTLESIAALDLVESKRALVVCLADITSNFTDEIRMWAPHRAVVDIHGMTKNERNAALNMANLLMENGTPTVVVVNYEAWRKDFSLLRRFGDMAFDTVIMDEAHTIKKTSTDAYKGTKEFILADNICPVCPTPQVLASVMNSNMRTCPVCHWSGQSFHMTNEQGIALDYEEKYWVTKSVKNLWTMTGTSILNKPQDIFGQLSLIDPHNFDNLNSFLRSYCHQDEEGKWSFGVGGKEALLSRLRGRYLARSMEDAGVVLPPQKPIEYELDMNAIDFPDQYRVIEQLRKHSAIVMSDGRELPVLAQIALITRQRQANVFPGGIEFKNPLTGEIEWKVSEEVTESIKIDKVMDLCEEYVRDQGKRVVVFSQFKTGLAEAERRLTNAGFRVVRFDGSTSDSLKNEIKTNFNKAKGEEAKWDIVLANYKTGGTGLNLTACEHTIIMDEEWNPGKRDQAYARTRRIGQDKETFIHILRIPNTVDTWLHGLITEKEEMINGFESDARSMQEQYLKALNEGKA